MKLICVLIVKLNLKTPLESFSIGVIHFIESVACARNVSSENIFLNTACTYALARDKVLS
jgi:hypothetical protein